jgi:hypothetical protein
VAWAPIGEWPREGVRLKLPHRSQSLCCRKAVGYSCLAELERVFTVGPAKVAHRSASTAAARPRQFGKQHNKKQFSFFNYSHFITATLRKQFLFFGWLDFVFNSVWQCACRVLVCRDFLVRSKIVFWLQFGREQLKYFWNCGEWQVSVIGGHDWTNPIKVWDNYFPVQLDSLVCRKEFTAQEFGWFHLHDKTANSFFFKNIFQRNSISTVVCAFMCFNSEVSLSRVW